VGSSQVVLPRVLVALGYPVVPFLERHLQEDVEFDCVELMKVRCHFSSLSNPYLILIEPLSNPYLTPI